MPLSPSDKMMRQLNETTVLNPKEESLFREWILANSIRDLDHPDSHYDYRGFWKENPRFSRAPGEHFTDKFKQFGHESFSKESKYARPGEGGTWLRDFFAPQLPERLRK